jgi:hypothetical protein
MRVTRRENRPDVCQQPDTSALVVIIGSQQGRGRGQPLRPPATCQLCDSKQRTPVVRGPVEQRWR